MSARAIVNTVLETEVEAGTLVIHKDDRTTDFLKLIYEGKGYPVITGEITPKELIEQIKAHPRIYMLGHGCSAGLFADGYLIDSQFAPYLREKTDGLYIWCHAEIYARQHKLSGLVSGMFISEVGEALANGIRATQEEVDASNIAFSKAVRDFLDKGLSPHSVKQCYNSATCKITQFNNARLFVMDKGVPMNPDGNPVKEEPRQPYRNDFDPYYDFEASPGFRRGKEERIIAMLADYIKDILRGAEISLSDLKPRNKKWADIALDEWSGQLNRERIEDEFVHQDEPTALAAIIYKTGLYHDLQNAGLDDLVVYMILEAREIIDGIR